MLNIKQYEMIRFLSFSKTYVIADTLARQVNISTRSVQRYVETINEVLKSEGIQIKASRGTGYFLQGNTVKIEQWLLEHAGIVEDDEERVQDMIRYLLDEQVITTEKLAVKMSYSSSTITKITSTLKRTLQKYDLHVTSKPYYGLCISGNEVNIRTLMSDYGFKLHKNRLKVRLHNMSKEEVQRIEDIVLVHLNMHNIMIADRDINDLLIRIIISISRCKQKHSIHNLPVQNNLRHHNFEIVYAMMNEIAQAIGVSLGEDEYSYVSIYSGFIIYNFNANKMIIEHDIHSFVLKVLEEITMISGIAFHEHKKIIHSLCAHLNILLTRINQNITLQNPLLQQIKSKYAMEMNYAIFLAKKIEETYHIAIREDELGYLAMYFCNINLQQKHFKRVVILCNYGVGTAQLIGERVKQEFQELQIVGIYPIHYLQVAIAQDIDLIISTVQIENYEGNKPLIVVDNFLALDSLANIKEMLYGKDQDMEKLANSFHKHAWFQIRAHTREEAIAQVGQRMMERGLITQDILTSISEREEISSTDIGNLVAIPHTIMNHPLPSIIGVGILEKTILWDKERVQLIFMIYFNNEDKANTSAFRYLYKVVNHISTVEKLIDSKHFDEFMQWLRGEK